MTTRGATMFSLDQDYIRHEVADSAIIFSRGKKIYECGSYMCLEADPKQYRFVYDIDGNYGDYTTSIGINELGLEYECDCPYPGPGCKHVVAVLLDTLDRIEAWKEQDPQLDVPKEPYLSPEEIRKKALEDREKRARNEVFSFSLGEMYKGEHLLETGKGRQYVVTLHDPENGQGHCSCPDFNSNCLNTCKHLISLTTHIKEQPDLKKRVKSEQFPFVDIFWDSEANQPRVFFEKSTPAREGLFETIENFFSDDGLYRSDDLSTFPFLLQQIQDQKKVRVAEETLRRVESFFLDQEVRELESRELPRLDFLNTELYPYQLDGIRFGLFKKGALIGDEMGLGKTLQAIALAVLKKELFGFHKVLVITMASLKEQWKREIEKFTSEQAVVVAGSPRQREETYKHDSSLFKITNYEAVLRDVTILSRFKPDLVILDEAQRIKNFATKTADAVKSLPRKHGLVLTGTPLENKLEDVYSIIQFLDFEMLSPLWRFAAEHFMLSRDKKDKILGYRNLDRLHEKLKSIVIRRRKEEVLSELPDELVNTYYLELTHEQAKMHNGYLQYLLPLLNKKFLTPMDVRRIQELLLQMRRVCDSTYLIDRQSNISPKLQELESILDELVLQNQRKVVIFSEWTTMTFLIGKQLSRASIPFVELNGKIPVPKRQALIDEFSNNPECKVFLSTDSGGTGLNLQAADCVVNFELPWNPARMNQRIGRVNRIGQSSKSVNVINLVSKNSIEEKILAGIHLKTELFQGVFDGTVDEVEFSREKRNAMLNHLREMMGQEQEDLSNFEPRQSEEIPEDTPHYLNPRVLQEEASDVDLTAEETVEPLPEDQPQVPSQEPISEESGSQSAPVQAQSPEKMEEVLNTGMSFISGLLEMATGKKLSAANDQDKLLSLDRETGEVTMKFKLPGF